MLSKNILTAALIMSLSLSLTAKADQCTDVVNACDKALAAADKVIDLKTHTIDAQKDIISALDSRVVQLEKDKSSIFKNPWLYFGLGVVTGALLLRK